MSWVRIDDHFDEHPKFAAAGPIGMALWLAGLAYANRNLTDGFIPWAAARNLVSWSFLGPDDGAGRKIYRLSVSSGMVGNDVDDDFAITLLLDCGLWEERDDGYEIHDYAQYQPTKSAIEATHALKQAAGQAGGQASAKARATAGAQAKSKPKPKPGPGSSSPVPGSSSRVFPSPEFLQPTAAENSEPAKPPMAVPKPNRSAEVIDALQALQVTYDLTPRDHAAIKHCASPPGLIAEAYAAAFRGDWDPGGTGWLLENLSVHEVIGRLAGYVASENGKANGRGTANHNRRAAYSQRHHA